jgi:glycine cleavage system aminomethyltransferase T
MTDRNISVDVAKYLDLNRYCNRRSPFFPGTEAAGCTDYDHINGVFLPVRFGRTIQNEYAAVREGIALYDTTLQTQIAVTGKDAEIFCDYVLTRSIKGLAIGRALYGFLCRGDGVIITDAVITRISEMEFWISPTIGDVILWLQAIVECREFDVRVAEADYISAHLHGIRSRDLLRRVVGDSIDGLKHFRSMRATAAGVDIHVSRTTASPVLGYEVFVPRREEPAMKVWNAMMAAGKDYGLIVRGYNDPSDAIESGMLFFSYWTSFEDKLNPLEFWRSFVDMNGGDFIGKKALADIAGTDVSKRRKLVGLVEADKDVELPMLGDKWEIRDGERHIGFTRWIVHSHTLDRNIGYGLLEASYADKIGAAVTLVHPQGRKMMSISEIPIVKPRHES